MLLLLLNENLFIRLTDFRLKFLVTEMRFDTRDVPCTWSCLWLYSPPFSMGHVAWGSIETTTTRKTHPTLYYIGYINLYLFVYDLAKSVRHAQYLYFPLMAFVVLLNNFVILSFNTFDTNPCLSFSYIGIVKYNLIIWTHSSLTIWTNKSILEVWVSVLIHVHFDSFFLKYNNSIPKPTLLL